MDTVVKTLRFSFSAMLLGAKAIAIVIMLTILTVDGIMRLCGAVGKAIVNR